TACESPRARNSSTATRRGLTAVKVWGMQRGVLARRELCEPGQARDAVFVLAVTPTPNGDTFPRAVALDCLFQLVGISDGRVIELTDDVAHAYPGFLGGRADYHIPDSRAPYGGIVFRRGAKEGRALYVADLGMEKINPATAGRVSGHLHDVTSFLHAEHAT